MFERVPGASTLNWLSFFRRRRASCVALYGSSDSAGDLQGMVDFVVSLGRSLGCEIDLCGIRKDGGPSGMQPLGELRSTNLSAAHGVSLKATTGPRASFFDWRISASLDVELKFATLCVDQRLLRFDPSAMIALAAKLSRYYGSCYGYAYEHVLREADLYPLGMIDGTVAHDESDLREIRSWMRAMTRGRTDSPPPWASKLRGIYPVNILSDDHLSSLVGRVTLRDWIQESPGRGRIGSFGDGLSVWQVTKEERRTILASQECADLILAL
jgi:hypothetical protein